jgi:hypothetical protein
MFYSIVLFARQVIKAVLEFVATVKVQDVNFVNQMTVFVEHSTNASKTISTLTRVIRARNVQWVTFLQLDPHLVVNVLKKWESAPAETIVILASVNCKTMAKKKYVAMMQKVAPLDALLVGRHKRTEKLRF